MFEFRELVLDLEEDPFDSISLVRKEMRKSCSTKCRDLKMVSILGHQIKLKCIKHIFVDRYRKF